jgi:GT2 family glycosyltransferase
MRLVRIIMQDNNIIFSIIIPLPRFNGYIREAVPYYERLSLQNFEIIILPDSDEDEILSNKLTIKIVPSGKVGPAEKRDLGAKYASGKILAFTDDDAYPDQNWLSSALPYFQDESVAAIGGPAVTPKTDTFWQRISGNVYSSFMTSFVYRKRYVKTGKVHEDFDLPSVNLIVRKDVFDKIGGFDSTFYPGEDTKLCLEIKKLGYKIIYNPDVMVFHHRRNLFPNHFRQIANYALHRGFFAKKFPETSRKLSYFVPSLFLLFILAGGIITLIFPILAIFYFGVLAFYFLLNIITAFTINLPEYFWTVIGVFLSHLVYGFNFLKGIFFTKDLKR